MFLKAFQFNLLSKIMNLGQPVVGKLYIITIKIVPL